MGTWKLHEAKSTFAPGMPKNNTVIYETEGLNVKVTIDGIDGAGNPTHNEWTGQFPGSDGELASRLMREARVLALLEHPGIVPVHDVGTCRS